jgi:hypothetical protein
LDAIKGQLDIQSVLDEPALVAAEEAHKADLWAGLFQDRRRSRWYMDEQDNVRRCSDCGNEVEDGECAYCGEVFSDIVSEGASFLFAGSDLDERPRPIQGYISDEASVSDDDRIIRLAPRRGYVSDESTEDDDDDHRPWYHRRARSPVPLNPLRGGRRDIVRWVGEHSEDENEDGLFGSGDEDFEGHGAREREAADYYDDMSDGYGGSFIDDAPDDDGDEAVLDEDLDEEGSDVDTSGARRFRTNMSPPRIVEAEPVRVPRAIRWVARRSGC